jgi:hypothetical protein
LGTCARPRRATAWTVAALRWSAAHMHGLVFDPVTACCCQDAHCPVWTVKEWSYTAACTHVDWNAFLPSFLPYSELWSSLPLGSSSQMPAYTKNYALHDTVARLTARPCGSHQWGKLCCSWSPPLNHTDTVLHRQYHTLWPAPASHYSILLRSCTMRSTPSATAKLASYSCFDHETTPALLYPPLLRHQWLGAPIHCWHVLVRRSVKGQARPCSPNW